MIRRFFQILLCGLLLAAAVTAPAQDRFAAETAKAMKHFDDIKFGLFIHWGLYAIPAGEWKGKYVRGIGEWIMFREKIPVAEYGQLTKQFNPVKFNGEEWAQLAQDAGMKYIWFDTAGLLSGKQVVDLRNMVKTLQPSCLINSRIGHNRGDYAQTGDNAIPIQVYLKDGKGRRNNKMDECAAGSH